MTASSSLGIMIESKPVRRSVPVDEAAAAPAPAKRNMLLVAGQYLFFAACFVSGVCLFAQPLSVTETITTVDLDGLSIYELFMSLFVSALTMDLNVTNETVPPAPETVDSPTNEIIKVLMRFFSSVVLLGSGSAWPEGAHKFPLLVAYATATGFAIATIADDDNDILEPWFAYTFLFVACVLPTLSVGMELWQRR